MVCCVVLRCEPGVDVRLGVFHSGGYVSTVKLAIKSVIGQRATRD
jgi:hypothetical protein